MMHLAKLPTKRNQAVVVRLQAGATEVSDFYVLTEKKSTTNL